MVSIVRGQIADPHLVAKARAGRPEDVRGCISCNQLCWGRRSRDYWISCLINPSAGREAEWGGDRFEPAAVSRSVLVVGGGPAGLETARVAAERGHRVTLVERNPALGGQFRLAGLQPSREQITDLIAWYGRQLEQLGVEVRLGVDLSATDIAALGADVVILATGSRPPGTAFQRARPLVDRLPGSDDPSVTSIQAVLAGASDVGPRVLVLDDLGDWRGLGTALHLVEAGHDVTIVTSAAVVAGGLFHSAADVPLRGRYARAGGRMITSAAVVDWRPGSATLESTSTGAIVAGRGGHARHRRDARRRHRSCRGADRGRRGVPGGGGLRGATTGEPRVLRSREPSPAASERHPRPPDVSTMVRTDSPRPWSDR